MAGIEELFEGFGAKTDRDQILIRLLKELYAISGGVAPPGGLATEATAISILNAIVASDQDIEILLVRDNGNGGVVLQQITDYQTGVPVITYKDVNGVVVVPVGPLEYLDPSAVLNLMLTEILSQGTTLDNIETNTTGLATQVTLASVLTAVNSIAGEDFATEVTLAGIKSQTDLFNFILTALEVNVTSSVLPTGASTEATLANLLAELQLKADLTETQPVSIANVGRVPTLTDIVAVGGGSILAGARSVSVKNNGAVPLTVAGGSLAVGESVGWDAGGQSDTLGAIAYNIPATGSIQILKVV